MIIRLTKESRTHHTLEVLRNDGTSERTLLETKSFMPHDLIHFLYERNARLHESFWGRIATGATFASLNDREYLTKLFQTSSELTVTESVVGPLQGFLQSGISPQDFLERLGELFEAKREPIPAHLTINFLSTIREDFRKLSGHWDSLKKGEPLELTFPD